MYYNYPQQQAPQQSVAPMYQSWLNEEERASLAKAVNQLDLNPTPEEKLQAVCNHFNANGNLALVMTGDQPDPNYVQYQCTVCGRKISVDPTNQLNIKSYMEHAKRFLDETEVIKSMIDRNTPADKMRAMFSPIAIIRKYTILADMAMQMADRNGVGFRQNNMGSYNRNPYYESVYGVVTHSPYQTPQSPFGVACGYAPMYPNQQQPMMGGIPMPGMAMNGMPNPMGMPQQQAQPMPANPLYGQMSSPPPVQPQQPVAPQAPQQIPASAIGDKIDLEKLQ